MPRKIRVLLVEDSPTDAALLLRALGQADFQPECVLVDTREAFLAALDPALDVVISDFELPQFNGLQALQLLRERGLEVPFVLVSGTIGEEQAVLAMRHGAFDYLLKDRLARLGQSVSAAMQHTRLRRESQAATAAQRRAEVSYGNVFTHAVEGIVMIDDRGTVESMNPAALRMFGYAENEIVGESVARLMPSPEAEQHLANLADHLATGTPQIVGAGRELNGRRKDGTVFPVDVSVTELRSVEGRRFAGFIRDITERRRAEQALRESEERFRELVETIHEVFWVLDAADNRVVYVSPGYEKIWGRSCAELMLSRAVWADSIHGADRARVVQAAMTKQPLGTYHESYRIVRPDGTERWVDDKAFPIKDETGQVIRIVGVAEDITERKKLEAQFLRAQRMEAIGALAGGVAHDLNNILAPMLMAAGLVTEHLRSDHDRQLMQIVEQSARRGADIVRQLLTFSRGSEGERLLVQPRHLIKEIVSIVSETFPREIKVKIDILPQLHTVLADATQLHQVMMNLCVNARDAMPEGGVLGIRAFNATLTEAEAARQPGALPGDYAVILVEDDGAGIAPELIDRIFDPFFTTKEVGKGTGLGLSTVLGIVKGHGGFLTVNSVVGRGSEFRIHLPASEQGPAVAPARSKIEAPGHGELVLVVDDESAIREATRFVLEQKRYRVISASNGLEALSLIDHRGSDIRIVVTDLMMPTMGGVGLVQALRQRNSRAGVIAVTGMAPGSRIDQLASLGVTEVLSKPYAPGELLAAVSRLLADKAASGDERARDGGPVRRRS